MNHLIANILNKLDKFRKNGDGWMAICPAHEDKNPSLSISIGTDGKILLYCHAGCSFDSIVQSLGMSARDLMPENGRSANGSFNKMTIKKIYPYVDEQGRLLYENVRFEPKVFRVRRPNGTGGHVWNLNGTRKVLYRLPEFIQSDSKEVLLTEGERDSDKAIEKGFSATTNGLGATNWFPEYNSYFKNKDVIIVQDSDPTGIERTEKLIKNLLGVANSIKVIDFSNILPFKGSDLVDYLEKHSADDLRALIDSTSIVTGLQSATASENATNDLVDLHLTDLGNAKRLVKKYGKNIRYCHKWRTWLVWDGKRWVRDHSGEAMRMAKDTIRSLYEEASISQDESTRKNLASWAIKSESYQKLEAMVKLAQSEPGIPIDPKELDANKWLFNTLNGTIDLTTGELRQHLHNDFITKLAPVEYDPEAKSELWDSFLTRNVPDPDTRAFLQRVAGYVLTGDTSEEKLFFIHGPTRTGKSTFGEAIKSTWGNYAKTANFETFIKRKFERNTTEDIARLAGARFVTSIEVDEGKSLAEQLLKTITGGDTVTVRALYESSFEFKPTFKLFLVANNRPKVRIEEEAIWNRIIQIPFCERLSEEEIDRDVKRKLINPEISGAAILAWAVNGCLEWQKIGLQIPKSVRDYTEQYKEEMNPLKEFLEECCLLQSESEELKSTLRKSYAEWCENLKETPIGQKEFPKIIKALGVTEHRTGEKRFWKGIKLLNGDTMT